jgi:hypothetical protein
MCCHIGTNEVVVLIVSFLNPKTQAEEGKGEDNCGKTVAE